MRHKNAEFLMEEMSYLRDEYIKDYLESSSLGAGAAVNRRGLFGQRKRNRRAAEKRSWWSSIPKAASIALIAALCGGGVGVLAAVYPEIGHYFSGLNNEFATVIEDYNTVAQEYGVAVGDTSEKGNIRATLNEVILEENDMVLSYTYELVDAAQSSYGAGIVQTSDMPWDMYFIVEDEVILHADSEAMHTQLYFPEEETGNSTTILYTVDLGEYTGKDLAGKEITVYFSYQRTFDEGMEQGFVASFTPKDYFEKQIWPVDMSYTFEGHEITINRVEATALYVTVFMDCDTFEELEDTYTFLLADERGDIYQLYPYRDNSVQGYWFTKPADLGNQFTLQIIENHTRTDLQGQVLEDSYDIIYEIPIELKASLWQRLEKQLSSALHA